MNLATLDPAQYTHKGRVPTRAGISSKEAKFQATELLSKAQLSRLAWILLNALAEGEILTDDQLFRLYRSGYNNQGRYVSFSRTLLKYYHMHLINRGPMMRSLRNVGLPTTKKAQLRTYTLGAVGAQVISLYQGESLDTGFPALDAIEHDLLVNEVVLRLGDHYRRIGDDLTWVGKRSARLMDDENIIREPDAMIKVQKQNEAQRIALIEYHNEDNSRRGADKIARYEETLRRADLWQAQWQSETFPVVFVVYRHLAVLSGYQRALGERRNPPKTVFLSKSLSDILSGNNLDEWMPIIAKTKK